jgi:hypothetical protein
MKMPRKKQEYEDSVLIAFRVNLETNETLRADAKRQGVKIGAYVSMLVNQKHIEQEAIRLMASVPPDKLKELMESQ